MSYTNVIIIAVVMLATVAALAARADWRSHRRRAGNDRIRVRRRGYQFAWDMVRGRNRNKRLTDQRRR